MTNSPATMIGFSAGLTRLLVAPAPGLATPLAQYPLAEVSQAVDRSGPAFADLWTDPVVLTIDAAASEHPLPQDPADPSVSEVGDSEP